MYREWRKKVWEYIYINGGEIANLYDPKLGHIGNKIFKDLRPNEDRIYSIDDLDPNEILNRVLHRYLAIEGDFTPYPINGIYDVALYLHLIKSRGHTYYTLPWYNELNYLYETLLRPIFKIPIDEEYYPSIDKLELNYEYDGIYHIIIPDKYTGISYIELLKKYSEFILEFGGEIFIDLTYGYLLRDEMLNNLTKVIEPVIDHTLIYIDLSISILDPANPSAILYIPENSQLDTYYLKRIYNVVGFRQILKDLLHIDISWNIFREEVLKELDRRKKILYEKLGRIDLESPYTASIKYNDSDEYAEKLLYSYGILVEPINTPVNGITINLYTECNGLEDILDKMAKEYE